MREKAFIIHVRGNKEREIYIKEQLKVTPFDYEFIEDGNIEDLTEDRLSTYFSGDLLNATPTSSCAFKHLLAYEAIVKNKLPYACIIEDDIEFTDNFTEVFKKSIAESNREKLEAFFISYEHSLSLFIRRSELKKNKILYKKQQTRCAGFYMIDYDAAKMMLEQAKHEKIHFPIDHWHNELIKKGLLNVYWSHPTIANQLSHNGKFASLIDGKAYGSKRVVIYKLKILYKKIRQLLG